MFGRWDGDMIGEYRIRIDTQIVSVSDGTDALVFGLIFSAKKTGTGENAFFVGFGSGGNHACRVVLHSKWDAANHFLLDKRFS